MGKKILLSIFTVAVNLGAEIAKKHINKPSKMELFCNKVLCPIAVAAGAQILVHVAKSKYDKLSNNNRSTTDQKVTEINKFRKEG